MTKDDKVQENSFAFTKMNYYLLFATIGTIILGLIVMSMDSDVFGFMAITLGPIILMLGFLLGFVAILYKPKIKK